MRVTYNLNDKKTERLGLEMDSYQVLAYGAFDDNSSIFLIANDNLNIIQPDESVLEIIDNDLSAYVQKRELNNGQDFFVHKSLLNYVTGFDNYRRITSNSFYCQSKISNFFLNNNYPIPEGYRNTVLNVNYKMNLIEGFLMFGNSYINNKNKSDYQEEIYFFVKDTFDTIVDEEFKTDKTIKQFEITEYKLLLRNFIGKYLYDQEENESRSVEICNTLFELIDSIFINKVDSIYIIYTYFDEVFAIGYENKYYCLNKIGSD